MSADTKHKYVFLLNEVINIESPVVSVFIINRAVSDKGSKLMLLRKLSVC